MDAEHNLAKYFASGFEFEDKVISSGVLDNDGGYHHLGRRIRHEGKSTNIDGLVVYGNNIIIVEAKNYTMIKGNYDDDYWYGKGKSRRFSTYSPIKQNNYHEDMLVRLMARNGFYINKVKLHKVIVVPDNCIIDTDELSKEFILTEFQFKMLKSKMRIKHGDANQELIKLIQDGV